MDFIQQTVKVSKVMELVTLENSEEQLYAHPNFACGSKHCAANMRYNNYYG